MSKIEIKHLTFGYGADLIFDGADVTLDTDWRLGLVGRNGRGKTTLLRLLTGELTADGSAISCDRRFVYFPQVVTDQAALTFYALSSLTDLDFEQWELERELSLLQVDLDVLWRPFASLSGGEQTKCLLALLFLDGANFPLLDEPTNHLDMASRQVVAAYLARQSGFIVVSHDRDFLNAVTDHTLAIERTGLALYAGDFAVYEGEKARRDSRERAENDRLQRDISRLRQASREKAAWSQSREKTKDASADSGFVSARAARLMKKSKNLEKRMTTEIDRKEGLLKNLEKVDSLSLAPAATHHRVLVAMEDFQLSYEGRAIFAPVTAELAAGQVLALTGANGAGKSSLVRALMGAVEVATGAGDGDLSRDGAMGATGQLSRGPVEAVTGDLSRLSGAVEVATDLDGAVAAATGDLSRLSGAVAVATDLDGAVAASTAGRLTVATGLTVSQVRQIYDNRGSLQDFASAQGLDLEAFLNNLRKLGLAREAFGQPIERMSQGQQKKVELAKSLSQRAQLYIWDEPTNYLDVFNHDQLIAVIKAAGPSMLLIEHDRHFIDAVATGELCLQRGA